MKNNILKSILILTLISFIGLQSCEKAKLNIDENDLLKFENDNEFNNELLKVISMNTSELKGYEESKGYKSFGRTCDEVYADIDFEDFKSHEELVSYINSVSDYLQIVEDEGELYVEPKFDNNIFRYLMNEDKMYAIGNRVYKGIENYTISSDIEHIEILKVIDETNYEQYMQNSHLLFSPVKVQTITDNYNKDLGHICGLYGGKFDDDRADNGSNRTKIEHEITVEYRFDDFIGYYTNVYGRALVRPYKKTLGIWYFCSRTISCDFKIAVGIKNIENNTWSREFDYYSRIVSDSKIEFIFLNRNYGGHLPVDFIHFDGYDSWGDTPSTGKAELQCHTELF